ncbi:hypothetical protein [Streptomyces sp. NPDC048636]|uniref:hypothetical protein n=1 Tax=Streptomyces sp. NPDC048636 TaxID=3155762 RepID=UPI00342F9EDC
MDIEWSSLVGVLVASFGVTVVVVVMFSLGIAAWSRADTYAERTGATRRALPHRGPGTVSAAISVVCFAACLAVAAYGIDLIIPG